MSCRLEVGHIKRSSYIRGVFLSLVMIATRFTIFITIVVYVLIGEEITAEKVL
jgi:hypothetical protein